MTISLLSGPVSACGNLVTSSTNLEVPGYAFVGHLDLPFDDSLGLPVNLPHTSTVPMTFVDLAQPSESNALNNEKNSPLEAEQACSWNSGSIDGLLHHFLQLPANIALESGISASQEEKRKKLRQLAEIKLAQEQLEAEIAALCVIVTYSCTLI